MQLARWRALRPVKGIGVAGASMVARVAGVAPAGLLASPNGHEKGAPATVPLGGSYCVGIVYLQTDAVELPAVPELNSALRVSVGSFAALRP